MEKARNWLQRALGGGASGKKVGPGGDQKARSAQIQGQTGRRDHEIRQDRLEMAQQAGQKGRDDRPAGQACEDNAGLPSLGALGGEKSGPSKHHGDDIRHPMPEFRLHGAGKMAHLGPPGGPDQCPLLVRRVRGKPVQKHAGVERRKAGPGQIGGFRARDASRGSKRARFGHPETSDFARKTEKRRSDERKRNQETKAKSRAKTKVQGFWCQECGAGPFGGRSGLKAHIKAVHLR